MDVAIYFYYEKVRRMMRTTIVSYLLKTQSNIYDDAFLRKIVNSF